MKLCQDRIAVVTALTGMMLMALHFLVSGHIVTPSVLPHCITGTSADLAVEFTLFLSCSLTYLIISPALIHMPRLFSSLYTMPLLFIIQGLIYFKIGQRISA